MFSGYYGRVYPNSFSNGISGKVKGTEPQDVASAAGARRPLINLSAKPAAIFIKEGIYVDNSGLECDGEVIEDNVFNVVYAYGSAGRRCAPGAPGWGGITHCWGKTLTYNFLPDSLVPELILE